MTASQTVPQIPGVLHRDHTVIVCPYACDNVIHYHGAARPHGGDSIVVPGHRVSHCYWYLPKQEWPAVSAISSFLRRRSRNGSFAIGCRAASTCAR